MKRAVIIPTSTARNANRGIGFDLADVLRALGSRALESRWHCTNLHCITRDNRDIEVLAQAGESEAGVDGAALLAGLEHLLLTLDGAFQATDANGRWLVIRVVQARQWQVWSDDEPVLRALCSRFETAKEITLDAG